MPRPTLSFSVCAVLFALPFETPRFTPKEGQTVTRTVQRSSKRTLDSVTLRNGDQEKTVDAPGLTVEAEASLVLEDTFSKVSEGRLTRLERVYKKLAKTTTEKLVINGEEKSRESKDTSGLEGKSVRFQFDPKQEEWSKAFAGEAGEKDLLDGLSAELDLAAFLPGKDVEPDTSWPIDFDLFRVSVVRPGGNMHFHSVPERVPMNERLIDAVWKGLEGQARGTWKGTRKVAGSEFGVIAVDGDMQLDAKVEREGEEAGPDALRVKGKQHFEGELLWDMQAGAARSLELENSSEFVVTEILEGKTKEGAPAHVERENHFSEKETEKLAFRRD